MSGKQEKDESAELRKKIAELLASNKRLEREINELKGIESAFRENEEKYRIILSSMEDGYFEVDLSGNMKIFNKAMCRILETAPEELEGKQHPEYTSPKTAEYMHQVFNKVYRTGVSESVRDFEILRKDGSIGVVELSAHLIRDNSGTPAGFYGIARDVTKRKRAEEALRRSEKKYRLIAENTNNVVETLNLDLAYTYVSPSVRLLRNISAEEAIQQKLSDALTPESLQIVRRVLEEELLMEKTRKQDPITSRNLELVMIRRDGSHVWVEATVNFIRDDTGKPVEVLSVSKDITERKKTEERLAYLAYHDPLTGLLNRKAFMERMEDSLNYAKRYREERALLFLDLDRFKQVNDRFGHAVGDQLLQEVASRLNKYLRKTDQIFRFGGDEFTIILNNPKQIQPQRVAEHLVENLSACYRIRDLEVDFISPSIGISCFPEHGHDVEVLIKYADIAMYKAKEKRRSWVIFSTQISDAKDVVSVFDKTQGGRR